MKTITYPNEDPYASLEERVRKLERRLSVAHGQLNDLATEIVPIDGYDFYEPGLPFPEIEKKIAVPEWANHVALLVIARTNASNGETYDVGFVTTSSVGATTSEDLAFSSFELSDITLAPSLQGSDTVSQTVVTSVLPGSEITIVQEASSGTSFTVTMTCTLSGLAIFRRTS